MFGVLYKLDTHNVGEQFDSVAIAKHLPLGGESNRAGFVSTFSRSFPDPSRKIRSHNLPHILAGSHKMKGDLEILNAASRQQMTSGFVMQFFSTSIVPEMSRSAHAINFNVNVSRFSTLCGHTAKSENRLIKSA